MKKHVISALCVLLVIVCAFCGCDHTEVSAPEEETKLTYEQITPSEAKRLMDTEGDYVILDVRTEEEYDEGHIEGAVLIPDFEINSKAEGILTDKNQLILVYCRSGRRSKLAAEALVSLGYTNVKEFGGIIDWEYGTVTE